MPSTTDAAENLTASARVSPDSDWLFEWNVAYCLALLLNAFHAQGIEYAAGRTNAINSG